MFAPSWMERVEPRNGESLRPHHAARSRTAPVEFATTRSIAAWRSPRAGCRLAPTAGPLGRRSSGARSVNRFPLEARGAHTAVVVVATAAVALPPHEERTGSAGGARLDATVSLPAAKDVPIRRAAAHAGFQRRARSARPTLASAGESQRGRGRGQTGSDAATWAVGRGGVSCRESVVGAGRWPAAGTRGAGERWRPPGSGGTGFRAGATGGRVGTKPGGRGRAEDEGR